MSNSASKDESIILTALLQYFIYWYEEFLAIVYGLEIVLQTSKNISEKQTLGI